MAAFNRAEELFTISNPLKGLKNPKAEPRLASFTPDEEQTLYDNLEPNFRNFLFAAIHTGLRPFCELAKLTADDIEETDRGMMWRVFACKTKKTRKIPVAKAVAKLTRRLLKTCPIDGTTPIFRNRPRATLEKVTVVHRFLAIKRDLAGIRNKSAADTQPTSAATRMRTVCWPVTGPMASAVPSKSLPN